jgi:hypothetical protein
MRTQNSKFMFVLKTNSTVIAGPHTSLCHTFKSILYETYASFIDKHLACVLLESHERRVRMQTAIFTQNVALIPTVNIIKV